MALVLRQSTSKTVSFGPFVDKTDGVALEVGLVSAIDHATTGILLSKNGGALTIRSQAVTASTYDAYGNYIVTLSTTDTNTVGTLRMQFSEAATCLPVFQDFQVVEEAVFDALYAAAATGVPALGALEATSQSILTDTAVIGVAGAGLTAVPWNAAWDAEVQSEVDDALVAQNLDHIAGTATAIPAIVAGTYLDQMMDDGTAVYDRTTDSLQAIRDTAPLGTAMRGTDSAALASVCTEARLAELDAANLPTDIAAVNTEIGVAGAGLTNINLPNQTMDITGSLSGSVGSVTGAVGSVTGAVGSVTAAVTVGTNNDKTGYALSAAGVTAVWAEVVDGTRTAVQAMRGFIAVLLGKASGLDLNAPKYRNIGDTKNVVDATTDADGNRTSVTLDLT